MESLLFLLGLGLFVFVFVLPIVALVTANKARRENERLEELLREQHRELLLLKTKVNERPAAAEPRAPAAPAAPAPDPAPAAAPVPPPVPVFVAPPPAPVRREEPTGLPELPPLPAMPAAAVPPAPSVFAATPAPAAPVVPPPLPASALAAAMADAKAEAAAHVPRPTPVATPPPPPPLPKQPAAPPPPPAKPFNWEQFLGVKGLAWAAVIAFALGAIYFLTYAIGNEWIPLEVQVAAVFVAGAGLLVGGTWSSGRGYRATGQSLAATGVVVLYAVTFACNAYYKFPFFTNQLVSFGLMSLITTVAFLLSVRLNAQVVATLGLVGGFITPPLLSTGQDNPLGLFGYITLLDLGLLAVALRCRWHHLVALAALGTAAMEVGWAVKFFDASRLDVAVAVVGWFAVLFPATVAVAKRWTKVDDWLAGSAFVPPLVAAGFAGFFLLVPEAVAQPGWFFTTVLVADLAVLALAWLHRPLAVMHSAAGIAAMTLTALWIGASRGEEMLPWALGFVLLLSALHIGFPFLRQRTRPDVAPSSGSAWVPLVALLVLFVPVLAHDDAGPWLWPTALVVNLLAIAAAAFSGRLAALAGAVVLTLILLGCAILRMPTPIETGAGAELWLIAGFALLFCSASVWLVRSWFARPGATRAAEPAWLDHLPSLSAGLPFALLVMLVFKFNLPDPSEVFGVGLLLVALLLGLATIARQGALAVIALLGVLLLQCAWHGEWFRHGAQTTALAWYLGFAAVFTAFPFVFRRRVLDLQGPCAASALALPLHFLLIYSAINRIWPNDVHGLIALGAAVPLLGALILVLRWVPADAPHRLNRIAWFGGAALFFLTLVFPLQFSNQWLTVSWALEGVALLWLFHRVPHPGLRLVGVGLLLAVFARLLFNAEITGYAVRSETPILNWILYTYGIAAAACFAGAKLLAPPRDQVLGVRMPAVLQVLGTILAFALVNLEIADFFTPPGTRVHLATAGNFARDMTYPIAWAGFALTILYLGIQRQMKWVRTIAALLLAAVFVRLLVNFDLFSYRGGGLAVWMLSTYGVVSVACFLAAHWFAPLEENVLGLPPTATLRVFGTILVFALLNLQIASHYTSAGSPLEFDFDGNFARDMVYTIAWALYAVVLLIFGIWKRTPAARWAAIALLGLTLVKLFFHDLWNMGTLYKVGALMGVAVVAFAASFLYQRFFGTDKSKP